MGVYEWMNELFHSGSRIDSSIRVNPGRELSTSSETQFLDRYWAVCSSVSGMWMWTSLTVSRRTSSFPHLSWESLLTSTLLAFSCHSCFPTVFTLQNVSLFPLSVFLCSFCRLDSATGFCKDLLVCQGGKEGEERQWVQHQNKKNGFGECHVAPGVRPEKDYLAPEVKMTSEIVCDHVWDKLSPPFCNMF
jgi:hypothetical protein